MREVSLRIVVHPLLLREHDVCVASSEEVLKLDDCVCPDLFPTLGDLGGEIINDRHICRPDFAIIDKTYLLFEFELI